MLTNVSPVEFVFESGTATPGPLSTALPALSIVASEREESPQGTTSKASWLYPQLSVTSLVALNCPEWLFKWNEPSDLL